MQITYRPMQIEDYEAVVELWRSTEGVGISSADTLPAIQRYLDRNPGMSIVACSVNDRGQDEIVGAVLAGHDGRRGFLHHLAVQPQFRKQGIGRVLVTRCFDCLRAAGIDKCHIFVYKTNETGRIFWQKMGWSVRETLMIMSAEV